MTMDLYVLAAGSALTGLIFYFLAGAQWSLWHLFTVPLYTLVFFIFSSLSIIKRFKSSSKSQSSTKLIPQEKNGITIVFGSVKGNSRTFAQSTYEKLSNELNRQVILQDLNEITDPEEFLQTQVKNQRTLIVFISTYEEGTPPPSAKWFLLHLQEAATDFRVSKNELEKLTYAVFGCGNSLYKENFNTVAKEVDRCLAELGAKRLLSTELADENTAKSIYGGLEGHYKKWSLQLMSALQTPKTEKCDCGNENSTACCQTLTNGNHTTEIDKKNDEQEEEELRIESDDDDEAGGCKNGNDDIMDLEDMGDYVETPFVAKAPKGPPKEMVTPLIRKSLEKQGYKLIGSHSGVKLCRWTKSMLRGRGGCYKHTFYGIESHRCMETTPSLACANKCVFCWRHHTNPVGTSWQWKTDDAQTVCQGAIDNHYKMINTFKGVPGVLPSRLAEGMQIRHCALSLVGEPIMYPHINELIDLLHSKKISSFLVTNAQFPNEIKSLEPVTQLYVSVDAATKESLKKIDRPLFRDFWERFLACLRALKDKGQRTVYRLTLVKGYNTEEIEQYAKLVELGDPDFIEVKGVTYCGDSSASNLTMANVPWHEEVVKFVGLLCERLPQFDVACEHEHSNCLLLANTKFRIDGKWHTWIDYERFHELVARHKATAGVESFTSLDYMAVTPDWAVVGSNERGFDPTDTRWHRKSTAKKDLSGC
jgi:tRNA wybutosine-synthesizing protein 1